MNRDGYIAQAAALEVARVIREGGHFFCPELPAMDVERFLSALAELIEEAAEVSLALVGYEVSETDLRDRLNAMGLLVGHVTTDLHVAAKWRNEPDKHPNIIALATGRYPGVSTLAHFPRGNARTLVTRLLEWAQTRQAALVRGRDAGYPAPPAQIRTCPLRHPAPPLGCALPGADGESLVRPRVYP